MRYDPRTEGIEYVDGLITDDRLKGLDKELAAYPFEGLGVWRSLVTRVTEGVLEKVMAERKEGRLDGMTGIRGVEEEDVRLNTRSGKLETEGKLVFPVVDAKRSWRDGAVGQEVTKYSKDKSWLLGDIVKNEGDGKSILARKMASLMYFRPEGYLGIPPTRLRPPTSSIIIFKSTDISTPPDPLYTLTFPTLHSSGIYPKSNIKQYTQNLHFPHTYLIRSIGRFT
jgi:hypothetical protein